MVSRLPSGYKVISGDSSSLFKLEEFARLTYQEIFSSQDDYSHLTTTIHKLFSTETPLWWVQTEKAQKIGCLWMGNAIDSLTNDRYSQIFLIFVLQNHRSQGIGTYLLQKAQEWAINRGDRQIGLQVFAKNQNAINLYLNLGFRTDSLLMLKPLLD
ncbi:N-acetyltransferase [Xenococcus sp. PCC 7305]|uniref:GNAT family N-acetyltransferase n=1 Tax=Xenococcus sp. PCC 7305 TaxID=102125 RepID=UPI0005938CAB|nr:GNAT family N-acetyltransferase [Xenococcus sp. PCC 7305]